MESTDGADILVERSEYFSFKDFCNGGHSVPGATEPGDMFHFAEGTVRPGFDTFFCISNPTESETEVNVTYMLGDDTSKVQSFKVPALSRKTIQASDAIEVTPAASSDFATLIESSDSGEIVVERPMYFRMGNSIDEGSCEMGSASLDDSFHFAEGCVRDDFDTYVLLMNPNDREAEVSLTFMKGDGTNQEESITLPPRTRRTVNVRDVYESRNDLMSVYSTYIEPLFWGAFTYQRNMARMIREALAYDPDLLMYKDYMKDHFEPNVVTPEANEFLSSVEQLVLSQTKGCLHADRDNVMSRAPGFRLPDKGEDVLMRAHFLASQTQGWTEGLNIDVPATQDIVPEGSVPVLRVRPSGGETEPVAATNTATSHFDWISRASDTTLRDCYYDFWTDEVTMSVSNRFSSARYHFGNVTEPGTYDVLDESGKLISTVKVDAYEFQDPKDPTKSAETNYGFTTIPMRKGGEPTLLNPALSSIRLHGAQGAGTKADIDSRWSKATQLNGDAAAEIDFPTFTYNGDTPILVRFNYRLQNVSGQTYRGIDYSGPEYVGVRLRLNCMTDQWSTDQQRAAEDYEMRKKVLFRMLIHPELEKGTATGRSRAFKLEKGKKYRIEFEAASSIDSIHTSRFPDQWVSGNLGGLGFEVMGQAP